jgi:prepilin-type N-terminal cleavage/methylation domain-containing protein
MRISVLECSVGRRSTKAFTLVELLVVIGIIGLLVAILMPALARARKEAQAVQCASNLKQIGYAIALYMNQNKGYISRFSNSTNWQNPAKKTEMIDPTNYDKAYWGVIYAVTGKLPKSLFSCPSAALGQSADGLTFDQGSIYTSYSQNSYGGQNSGFSDAKRMTLFGSKDEIALFNRIGGSGRGGTRAGSGTAARRCSRGTDTRA